MNITHITIHRSKTRINKNFSYKIVDDRNHLIGEIKNGETKTFQIDNQVISIKAKLMWCSSQKICTDDLNIHSNFTLTENAFLNRTFPFLAGLFPLAFLLSRYGSTVKSIALYMLIGLLLLIAGTLTIARNSWLVLKKGTPNISSSTLHP